MNPKPLENYQTMILISLYEVQLDSAKTIKLKIKHELTQFGYEILLRSNLIK